MAFATLRNVTKTYGPVTVLEQVGLVIHPAEKVGLIGANGAGKTTLFRLITGEIQPDVGEVTRRRNLRIGYLAQDAQLDASCSVLEEVGRVFDHLARMEHKLAELSQRIADRSDSDELHRVMDRYDRLRARFEAAGGYNYHVRIGEVLGGLGFAPAEYSMPVSSLSGGQKSRLALAKLLLVEADLLLLDEPTNHLDIPATTWLEEWLTEFRGSVIVVSHDRYLLDRVVNKIIEVQDRRLATYGCSYTEYVRAKEAARLAARREYEKQRAFIAKEKRFIDRIIATKRGSTAKGRRTRLERMAKQGELLSEPTGDAHRLSVSFGAPSRGGDMILRCEKVSKRYGDVVLFDDFDFEVQRGEVVGVIGGNGVGKTTLLRMALGQVQPDAGTVRLYENLRVGYYDQQHEGINRENTVIDEIMPQRCADDELRVRSFLAAFLFRDDDVFKRVGSLSGGEQSRVMLAKLVWSRPQVLLLDEPTNHLDIPGREALEQALKDFEGGVLIVSHDRYLLDRIAQKLLVLERGKYKVYEGNYSYYAAKIKAEAGRRAAAKPAAKAASKPRRTPTKTKTTAEEAAPDPYARLSLEELEQIIEEKETRVREIETCFAEPDFYRDPPNAVALTNEYQELRAEVETLTTVWMERADQAE